VVVVVILIRLFCHYPQVLGELKDPRVSAVSKVVVHYLNLTPSVEVFLKVDPSLSIEQTTQIAQRARALISEQVKDVTSAEIHIDVNEPQVGVAKAYLQPQIA